MNRRDFARFFLGGLGGIVAGVLLPDAARAVPNVDALYADSKRRAAEMFGLAPKDVCVAVISVSDGSVREFFEKNHATITAMMKTRNFPKSNLKTETLAIAQIAPNQSERFLES